MEDTSSKPYVIVFEGVDRSGKDTLIEKVDHGLNELGYSTLNLRNPDHPVRELLLSVNTDLNSPESLLVFYAGYLHSERRIKEASPTPDVVLINRRIISSFIYQNIGVESSPLTFDSVRSLIDYSPLSIVDFTVVLDVDQKELLRRTESLKLDENDRYESSVEKLLERGKRYREVYTELSENGLFNKLTKTHSIMMNNNLDDLANNVDDIVTIVDTIKNIK